MNDLISRQAAIDALKQLQKNISGDYTELNPMVMAGTAYIGDCIGELQDMPSAQQDCTECAEYDHERHYCQKYCNVIRRTLGEAKQERTGRWIPCSERLPEEDHWLGGSGKQFSDNVMVTIVNHSDEDTWVDMTYTIDGEWACELPKYCKIVAWMPLPEPYQEGEGC